MFFGAAISAILGWGLWTLKNWARIVVIALSCLRLAFLGLFTLLALLHFHILTIVWNFFWMGVSGVIIWYLLQPHVRQAFTSAPSPMAAGA